MPRWAVSRACYLLFSSIALKIVGVFFDVYTMRTCREPQNPPPVFFDRPERPVGAFRDFF